MYVLNLFNFTMLTSAGWQSGNAADCKSVNAGSIPTPASFLNQFCLLWQVVSPGGGIGRHKGLKIPRRKLRAGSTPAPGTITII